MESKKEIKVALPVSVLLKMHYVKLTRGIGFSELIETAINSLEIETLYETYEEA